MWWLVEHMGDDDVVIVAVVVLLGASGLGANPVLIAQTLRHAGHGSALGSSLATSAFNLGTAVGSAVAGATLSSSWGLVGPAALGAILTGSALAPIALLAATTTRRTDNGTPNRRREEDAGEYAHAGSASTRSAPVPSRRRWSPG